MNNIKRELVRTNYLVVLQKEKCFLDFSETLEKVWGQQKYRNLN